MVKTENIKGLQIGIDARLWNVTGIGRYIRNLVFNLLQIDEKNSYVLFVKSSEENEIKDQITKLKINNPKIKIVTTDIKWHSINEQIKFPKIIEKENLDLMHFTYQQSVPIFYKRPFVITIHDLIKHHYITGRSSSNPYWLLGFKMLAYKTLISIGAKKAKKIIAVSNATKNEIYDHLPVDKRNVEVIYEAADDFKINNIEKNKFGEYFLYVGNVFQHKNAENLIKAFNKINTTKKMKLIFVGKSDEFQRKIKKNNSNLVKSGDLVFIEDANDELLASLYKHSISLIRPSLMEGFSLAPLEALQNETLALVSDIPAHKEILKECAIYFNPNDYIDIANKMLYVLNLDKRKRELKIADGKKLSKEYSWEKTANLTLNIYENTARNNNF